jgi:hypothetical protein
MVSGAGDPIQPLAPARSLAETSFLSLRRDERREAALMQTYLG